jgi:small subunit ribosomal protein S4e
MVMITGGNNIGKYGTIIKTEHHPASFDIVHVREANQKTFATRSENLYIIGKGHEASITLPKSKKPYKLNILEEKAERIMKKESAKKDVKQKK